MGRLNVSAAKIAPRKGGVRDGYDRARSTDGADAQTAGTPPSYPDWVFPSLRGQEVACWCCGTNQEESYHAQMSVAVYKTNSGHLQGHLEGARHTQAHIHTNEDTPVNKNY